MRLLALETATLAGGAALIEDGRLVGESRLNIALTHSERLMAVVDRLLQDCGWDVASLDALAVSIGPGSFTGLRIGAATAKGLALALEIPVAPVPTLDALAATLPFADATVCPLLAARRDEVYCSLYRWTGRAMARRGEYLALPPEAAVAQFEPPVIVLGDGVAACRPFLARLGSGVREADPVHSLPSPAAVGALGHAMLAAGGGILAERLTPLYLRPSEAELRARHA
jgi:tRNA threonylcarbamoyladenosine biosynthesis protein TsaB